jgi:hypothetical protein
VSASEQYTYIERTPTPIIVHIHDPKSKKWRTLAHTTSGAATRSAPAVFVAHVTIGMNGYIIGELTVAAR